ncbi:hypothetical protein CLOSTMETH_01693 [[Clostridium] methylpentosum DSM 5476]|uniref:Uncharacterized protein n=1 Tax=[Clostridium] methylpentosum DSM 5476 TaxID=537013 RepID=C0ECX2_9FIRM|nr:hypothetical protein CLOSTMETH_01693 [[Clostridium] methylpentosum DSM 5476]
MSPARRCKSKNTRCKTCIGYFHIYLQCGGPDGELSASQRYLSQRYTMPYQEVKGILTDIGTEESVRTRSP